MRPLILLACAVLSLLADEAPRPPGLILAIGIAVETCVGLATQGAQVVMLADDDAGHAAASAAVARFGAAGQVSVWRRRDADPAAWPPRLADAVQLGPGARVDIEALMALCADGGVIDSPDAVVGEHLTAAKWPRLSDQRWRKPPTPGLDDWPMFQHDPGRTASSADVHVGPPQVARWIAGPAFGEIPVVVSDGLMIAIMANPSSGRPAAVGPGRGSFGMDDAIIRARRVGNGILAWQQNVRLTNPAPTDTHPLGGCMGSVMEDTGRMAGVVSHEGILYVRTESQIQRLALRDGTLLPPIPAKLVRWLIPLAQGLLLAGADHLSLVDPATGAERWSVPGEYRWPACGTEVVVAALMEATGRRRTIEAYALTDGKRLWSTTLDGFHHLTIGCVFGDEVIVTGLDDDIPLGTNAQGMPRQPRLARLALADGTVRWRCPDGALRISAQHQHRFIVPAAGALQTLGSIDPELGQAGGLHTHQSLGRTVSQGCQLSVATPNFVFFKDHLGFDLHSGEMTLRPKMPGLGKQLCAHHVIPAQGLIFGSPRPCGCMLAGAFVHAGVQLPEGDPLLPRCEVATTPRPEPAGEHPVERGSADAAAILKRHPRANGWSQLLGTAARDGSAVISRRYAVAWSRTDVAVGRTAKEKSTEPIGFPVLADGLAVVSEPLSGIVTALDARTGQTRWRWLANAPVTAAPVLWRGLVIVGSADGWITCLDAADGRLCWRTRVAPGVRLMVAHGRLTSQWPATVPLAAAHDDSSGDQSGDTVTGIAGNFPTWGGGMRCFRLDLATGTPVWIRESPMQAVPLAELGKVLVPATGETARGPSHFGGGVVTAIATATGDATELPSTVMAPALGLHTPLFGHSAWSISTALGRVSVDRTSKPPGIAIRRIDQPDTRIPTPGLTTAIAVAAQRLLLAGSTRQTTSGWLTVLNKNGAEWTPIVMELPLPPILHGMAVDGASVVVVHPSGAITGLHEVQPP